MIDKIIFNQANIHLNAEIELKIDDVVYILRVVDIVEGAERE